MTRKALPEKNATAEGLRREAAGALKSGRAAAGVALLEKALNLSPRSADLLHELGVAYWRAGQPVKAEKSLLQATRLNPGSPHAHAGLGRLLLETNRMDFAEKAFRHALTLDHKSADAWGGLAEVCFETSREDEAIECYYRAIELRPENQKLWLQLMSLLEIKGRVSEASELLQRARQLFDSPGIVIMEAKLLRRQGKTAEALAILEKHHAFFKNQPARKSVYTYFFELGRLYEKLNEDDKAFAAFAAANAAQDKLEGKEKDKQACRDIISYRVANFTPELAKDSCPVPPLEHGRPPVFLVGFPRSGTTLLDQILSSQGDIFVAEEKNGVGQALAYFIDTFGEEYRGALMAKMKPGDPPPWNLTNPCYPVSLNRLRTSDLEEMRRIFYQCHGIDAAQPQKTLFIDKLPLNMVHAGFIKRLFPDAKFILALRHPCDSVLSCFMQEFRPNPYMQRFLQLEDAARFYNEVFSLWDHYEGTLDLNVHTIRYEDVVADFRPTVASLLEFLEVDWNDAVLEYDKTALQRNRIRTPSYHQVTEKIYTRASGRWLRYRKHLAPVLPILEPWALKHGYSMEEKGEPERMTGQGAAS